MKLSPREADGYFAKPDPEKAGLLIYGTDSMRVALKRQQAIAALVGPQGEEEMRLTRIAAADLRKDPAMLLDAVKATGFFPGPRVAFAEDATDTVFPAIEAALADWQPGDAQIVVTAGQLRPTSKLRKLFEGHRNAVAAAIYDDPPSRGEIERMLTEAGVGEIPADAMGAMTDLSRQLGPGDFRQTVEKIALYKLGDPAPLSVPDIEACAPRSIEAGVDDVLDVVAEGRSGEIAPLIQRLEAQGVTAVSLCIGAARHFRQLHAIAAEPGAQPRVFGPRRDRILRQAKSWGAPDLETALTIVTDTDLQLRSAGQRAPAMALVERMMIRLAMLAARR